MIESSSQVLTYGPYFSKVAAKPVPNLSQELNDAIIAFYSDAVPHFPSPDTHPNEVYYYQGVNQFENGLFEKALESLQKSQLETEQRILLISWIQLQTNPDEAIKTLDQSKEKVFSQYILGLAHLKKGDKQEAQKFLKQSADANDPHKFYAQIELKRQAKQYAEAIKLFEELLKKDSTNQRLKYGFAELLLERELNQRQIQWGDLEIKPDVKKSFVLLSEISKDNFKYQFLLAQVNYYLDQPADFDSFIQQNYQVDQANYFKGLIEKEVLNYSKAQEYFQKAYQSKKSDIYYIQSAQMFIELKQAEKALKELDNVANGCHQYITLGQAYLLKGDREQAQKWFEEALKAEPNLYAQIYKFSLLDRVDEVQKLLDQGIKQEPNNYVLLWQKGKLLNRLQKFQDSLKQFDKAIAFKYVPAYASKAKALRSLNKCQDAINLTDEGLKLKKYPPLYTVKASALIDLKKYDEAIQACDELLQIQSDNVHALKFKALASKLSGKIQESVELYDKITQLDPQNLQAQIGKAVVAKESGDIKTYKEQITKIQGAVGSAKNPIVQGHTNDLIKLKKNFDSKGDVIESISAKDSTQYQEFQLLKQQKEAIETQKLQIITQPHLKPTAPDQTQQILDRLELLSTQVEKLQKENERLRYQNLLQDTKISEITKEQLLIWENLKSSGVYERAKIQEWFESCKETEKYNYAIAFYWTLLNHFNSYTIANVGALSQNKGFTEDGQQSKMVGYADQILVYASNKLTTSIPVLGNIYSLIDDVIDYCYSQVRDKRYADRIRSIIKIINENGTSTIAENLSLVIAKAAQVIADQTDFTQEEEKKQLNFIEETINDAKQIYDGKVNELREAVFGKNITIYQNLGGKRAIRDVISVIAYLQENYAIIIANSKSTPLDQQISEIVLEQRSNELLKKSHSQPSKQPLSKFDPQKSSVNFEDIIRRDEEGKATSGCCIIQ